MFSERCAWLATDIHWRCLVRATSKTPQMRIEALIFCAALSQFVFEPFENRPVGVAIEFNDPRDGRHRVFDVFV